MANNDHAVQVRDLARVLRPDQALFDPTNLRKAIVVAVKGTTPPSVDINLSGDTTQISNIAIMNGYSPYVGDVVIVAKQGNGLLVMGSVSDGGGWTKANLLGGYTHDGNGGGDVEYRRKWDGGWKMEWRGCCLRNTSSNQIITGLSNDFTPQGPREVMSCRQDYGTDTVTRFEFSTAGNVWMYGWDARPAIIGTVDSFTHSHGGSANPTTITPTLGNAHCSVDTPGWVSFENVSYYL